MATIIRAPIDQPFTVDQRTGVITNQAWLAYFTRGLTPDVNALVGAMDPPDVPLELGKDRPQQNDGSGGVTLPLPGRSPARPNEQFPPASRQDSQSATVLGQFPPGSRTAQADFDLAMITASQQGRQQQVWLISDTIANQGKYPNSSYPVNSLFIATDTKLVYYNTGVAWTQIPINLATPGTYGDATHIAQITIDANDRVSSITDVAITAPPPTSAQIIAALGYTPATVGGHPTFALTADLVTGAVTGTITQV